MIFWGYESGFDMIGYVPYGWQPKGEYIKITPSKTQGTQIFGLMRLDNKLESYSCIGSMNSQTIIAFIDNFHKRIKQPTVVVLDYTPIHHSKEFEANNRRMERQGFIYFLLTQIQSSFEPN